jgi:hypothetical protein
LGWRWNGLRPTLAHSGAFTFESFTVNRPPSLPLSVFSVFFRGKKIKADYRDKVGRKP